MDNPVFFLVCIVLVIIGIAIGYAIKKYISEGKINRELLLEAKEEIHKLRNDSEADIRIRRKELQTLENRLVNREESVEKKISSLERKEDSLNSKIDNLNAKNEKADKLIEERELELQRISGLTADEGKKLLLSELEKEMT